MVKQIIALTLMLAAFSLAGCDGKSSSNNSTTKPEKNHGELHWVSRSPEETFQGVQHGILNGELDDVYEYYARTLKLVQNREGLEAAYQMNKQEYIARFRGASIIPGSTQYSDERRAVCRIRWGNGDITAYSFILEEDGWKLGHEIVSVQEK